MTRAAIPFGRILVAVVVAIVLLGIVFVLDRARYGSSDKYGNAALNAKCHLICDREIRQALTKDFPSVLSPSQKAGLSDLVIKTPLRGGYPLDFASAGHVITIPMASMQFIDDLSGIQAWSDWARCKDMILPRYLYRLTHTKKQSIDPMMAFGLDRQRLYRVDDINETSTLLLSSASNFIWAHELGHVVHGHNPTTGAQAIRQEAEADAFALQTMGKLRLNPLGASLVLLAQAFYEPGDVNAEVTHPASAERILAVANALNANPVTYVKAGMSDEKTQQDVATIRRAAQDLRQIAAQVRSSRDRVNAIINDKQVDPGPTLDRVFPGDLQHACPQGRRPLAASL